MSNRLNLWSRPGTPAPTPNNAASPQPTAVLPPTPRVAIEFNTETAKEKPLQAGEWRVAPSFAPEEQLPVAPGDRRFGPRKNRRVPAAKARMGCVSISVSEEEETILRAFAQTLETSFSDWARQALFRAMGRKLPKRETV